MSEWIYESAAAMAAAIRKKEISAHELVCASLRRIDEVNPRLNAVVQVCAERAIEEAHYADQVLARGDVIGPLHGVPFTLKDAIETKGVICTGGTEGRAHYIPNQDAVVVKRLREAGAILLGKTNCPELGWAWEADNLIYGRTNNPYDLSLSPGGSSGGESAIIAAGGSPFGLGSDAGGSVRFPAHCTGIASRRILALDFGARNIGLAVSDELGLTAQGLLTYWRSNKKNDFDHFRRLIKQYAVSEIVMDFPRMSRAEGIQAEKVHEFADELRRKIQAAGESVRRAADVRGAQPPPARDWR